MKTKTIRQSATFKASAHEVYEMLMDSRKHTDFTGEKAKISRDMRANGFIEMESSLEGSGCYRIARYSKHP